MVCSSVSSLKIVVPSKKSFDRAYSRGEKPLTKYGQRVHKSWWFVWVTLNHMIYKKLNKKNLKQIIDQTYGFDSSLIKDPVYNPYEWGLLNGDYTFYVVYRGSPTYGVFTTSDPTTVIFDLCMCKWGIFALVGYPLESQWCEFCPMWFFSSPKIRVRREPSVGWQSPRNKFKIFQAIAYKT